MVIEVSTVHVLGSDRPRWAKELGYTKVTARFKERGATGGEVLTYFVYTAEPPDVVHYKSAEGFCVVLAIDTSQFL